MRGSTEVSVSVGTSSTEVLGPSKSRQEILISAPSQFRVSFGFRGAAVLDQGLTIYPGMPPIRLCREYYGDLLDYGLNAIAPSAQQLNVIDTNA